MHLTDPNHRRPPLIGVALAIGLHLALLISVQITSSKSAVSNAAWAAPAVMVVRSIDAPSLVTATAAATATPLAAEPAVPAAAAPSESLAVLTSPSTVIDARSSAPLVQATTAAASKSATADIPTVAAASLVPAPPSKAEAPTGTASEPLPAAPQYRAAGSLDPGPKPLSDINPDYPARAGQQQGVVVLRLLINEHGVVDNVAVVRAMPAGYFEASALEAFGKALFSPGRLLGVAVKSQITIEVEFMPINRGATVSGRTY
jgi:periplasmic protein TonB